MTHAVYPSIVGHYSTGARPTHAYSGTNGHYGAPATQPALIVSFTTRAIELCQAGGQHSNKPIHIIIINIMLMSPPGHITRAFQMLQC